MVINDNSHVSVSTVIAMIDNNCYSFLYNKYKVRFLRNDFQSYFNIPSLNIYPLCASIENELE